MSRKRQAAWLVHCHFDIYLKRKRADQLLQARLSERKILPLFAAYLIVQKLRSEYALETGHCIYLLCMLQYID